MKGVRTAIISFFLISGPILFTLLLLGQDSQDTVNVNNKVPDAYAVRLLKIQHDIDTIKARDQQIQMQVQQQFQADDATLKHDQEEIEHIKRDALAEVKKDAAAGWDVDMDAMTFVAKAVAPAPTKPEVKK